MRLDLYLFVNGYVKSRQKAKILIETNNVTVNNKTISKPSFDVDEKTEYDIKIFDDCKYVSRGGIKLEKILDLSKINVTDAVCLDIGASTGGFTDCLLQHGAKKVFALDSGTNQLDQSLKNSNRVVSIENFNAKSVDISIINEMIDVITIDVSFISQTLIMKNAFTVLKDDGKYVSLIKPQFEVGREKIGKGGIVKKEKDRLFAVNKVIDFAENLGYCCTNFIKSPISGGDGNIEYLAIFEKSKNKVEKEYINKIVLDR
ncbi:MAG: TlyA family RNA methyltransferase [Clostridia bacterium]|nr:TlyA family RNA methyltransferase [Clostridia bacterium]